MSCTCASWTMRLSASIMSYHLIGRRMLYGHRKRVHSTEIKGVRSVVVGGAHSDLLGGSGHLVQLSHRTLIRVYGADTAKLLQGLVTNDMDTLLEHNVMFGMFLNVQGRVLHDVFVYRLGADLSDLLVEVDVNSAEDLTKHMRTYKLRSKVKFENCGSRYQIFAEFNNARQSNDCESTCSDEIIKSSNVSRFVDPRTPAMGSRLIVERGNDAPDSTQDRSVLAEYTHHRFKEGVAEGREEYVGSMPLEYNLALMNGVSFLKGCYIGQELVARTHHTGVIRKRVMPIIPVEGEKIELNSKSDERLDIMTNAGKRAGKLLSWSRNSGIGLMRLAPTLSSSEPLILSNYEMRIETSKPYWWPNDLAY